MDIQMKGNLMYFILINSQRNAIVVDYKTDDGKGCPDVGYITEFDDWKPTKEEHMEDNDIWLDEKKAFPEPGLYAVDGRDEEYNTPDGHYYDYIVLNITKLSDLPYKV
jgi:hypothetical protein